MVPPQDAHDTFFRLIENAPFGVYLVDSQFCLRQVSAGAQKVFSHVRPLIGRDFAEVLQSIWGEPFASEAIGRFRHTLDTGEPYGAPNTTEKRRDIEVVESYDWKIERITLPDGEPAVVCYFYDITARQAAQASVAFLSHLSQQLATVTEAAEVNRLATQAVGEFLQVHRCYLVEVLPDGRHVKILTDWRQTGPDLAGVYGLDDFGNAEWLAAQERGAIAVDDLRSHPWTKDFADNYVPIHMQAYAVAPYLRDGRWVAAIGVSSDLPRHWTAEDMALLENVVARVWPVIERARSVEALRESEERFRSLFGSIDEGFCIIEMIFDAQGKAADYRFIQANRAFESLTGLRDVIGKTALELVPDLERFWIEAYGQAAITGEPVRFENKSESMGRWFDVHASRLGDAGSHRVAVVFSNITERKRAEEALALLTLSSEQQRRLYQTILTNSPDLIYVFDLNHRFTYANQALLTMWGRTWEDSVGKNCLELGYEPWHAAMHDEEIDRVIATRQPIRGEVPFAGTQGRRIYDYIFVPVIGSDGEVEAISGTTRDVTERKEAEEAVRQRTAQFETLLNQAPLGVYLVDDQFRITHVNPSARPVFAGLPDVIGRDFDEVIRFLWPKDFADEVLGVFRHTLETGEPFASAERGAVRQDLRTTEYYEWRTDRITLPDGHHGVVCYFQDITAHVRARERILESEERFRTLVSVITDVPWVADAGGAFSSPQPAWQAFTGQNWEEYREFRWLNALHPEDRDAFRTLWRQSCEHGAQFESHGRMWHAGTQQWRHFVARAAPLRYQDGSVREWVGTCTDTDVQQRAEEALRDARDEAEKASRAKDRFLAVLSHELRTPLTPVLMALAALEHDPELSAAARDDVAMMKRNIELETKLIDDLLDLSRITSGKLELKAQPVDLREAVLRVCDICRPQAHEQGVRLVLEPTSEPLRVSADAARLQQMLWNVVRNAIKFTPEGGTVTVTAARLPGERCEIRVQDTGIGIPAASLPHIFDAFEQGGSQITRQFGGLGLGLAITKTLVELHGGAIRAESTGENQGATFVLELRATEDADSVSPPDGIAAAVADARKPRLLLVDDHSDTLRTLGRMLQRAGYDVLTACDVASAASLAENEVFDLLVSDLGLPDGSGYEVIRHVRRYRDVPGIAMSGYGMEEDLRRSHDAGFAEHLVKPIDIAQLVAAIQRVVLKE